MKLIEYVCEVCFLCDLWHDLKLMLGFKKHNVSLLANSVGHLNKMSWLERVNSNGIIEHYRVK